MSAISTLGSLGTAISPWTSILGLGFNVGGALLDDSAEKEAQFKQQQLAEQIRQYNQDYDIKKQNIGLNTRQQDLTEKTAGQNSALSGLGFLADQRARASQLQRFRTALNTAAGGR